MEIKRLHSALDKPWEHLLVRDKWEMPEGATSEQVHFMIECMENWFLADPVTLQKFFGQGFYARCLPNNSTFVEAGFFHLSGGGGMRPFFRLPYVSVV